MPCIQPVPLLALCKCYKKYIYDCIMKIKNENNILNKFLCKATYPRCHYSGFNDGVVPHACRGVCVLRYAKHTCLSVKILRVGNYCWAELGATYSKQKALCCIVGTLWGRHDNACIKSTSRRYFHKGHGLEVWRIVMFCGKDNVEGVCFLSQT